MLIFSGDVIFPLTTLNPTFQAASPGMWLYAISMEMAEVTWLHWVWSIKL